jgi:hypothetical protein
MTDKRIMELLLQTLEAFRSTVLKHTHDRKDTDDFVFAELNMSVSEIEEIYAGTDIMLYTGSAIDDRFVTNKAQKQDMIKKLFQADGIDSITNEMQIDSDNEWVSFTDGTGVEACVTVIPDRQMPYEDLKYRIFYDAGGKTTRQSVIQSKMSYRICQKRLGNHRIGSERRLHEQ